MSFIPEAFGLKSDFSDENTLAAVKALSTVVASLKSESTDESPTAKAIKLELGKNVPNLSTIENIRTMIHDLCVNDPMSTVQLSELLSETLVNVRAHRDLAVSEEIRRQGNRTTPK